MASICAYWTSRKRKSNFWIGVSDIGTDDSFTYFNDESLVDSFVMVIIYKFARIFEHDISYKLYSINNVLWDCRKITKHDANKNWFYFPK